MRPSTARALKLGNEKGRLAGRPVSKLNIYSNSEAVNNITTLRLQRLLGCGLAGRRAALIASIAWEVQHG